MIKLALIAAPVLTSYLPTTPFDWFHAEFVARKVLKLQGPNPLVQKQLLNNHNSEKPEATKKWRKMNLLTEFKKTSILPVLIAPALALAALAAAPALATPPPDVLTHAPHVTGRRCVLPDLPKCTEILVGCSICHRSHCRRMECATLS